MSTRPPLFELVLFVCLWCAPGALAGQDAPAARKTPIYLTAGLGPASAGIGGQVALSVHASFGELTLRTAGVTELDLFGPGDNNASDVALLYGVRRIDGRRWVSVAAGPSVSWTTRHECVDTSPGFFCGEWAVADRTFRPGLAVQAVAGWRATSISVLLDANAARSFAALTVNVHLGRLR